MTIRIVVATGNRHKVTEIAAALSVPGFEFVSITDIDAEWPSPIEDGITFEDNAAIKALAAAEAFGLPALADDSGLVVDALDGAPGVYSSRYAGEEGNDALNNEKLLAELESICPTNGLAAANRTARFVSSLVLVGLDQVFDDAPAYIAVEGTCEGIITLRPRGENGFGYDPLFAPFDTPGYTMAELSLDEKNTISHRGHALTKLAAQLEGLMGKA